MLNIWCKKSTKLAFWANSYFSRRRHIKTLHFFNVEDHVCWRVTKDNEKRQNRQQNIHNSKQSFSQLIEKLESIYIYIYISEEREYLVKIHIVLIVSVPHANILYGHSEIGQWHNQEPKFRKWNNSNGAKCNVKKLLYWLFAMKNEAWGQGSNTLGDGGAQCTFNDKNSNLVPFEVF